MKKLLSVLLAGGLVLGATACAASDSDLEQIKEKGTLVVGVTHFEPLDYLDEAGNWTGFDAELARAFGASLDLDVELQEINWASKENELNGRTIDVIWNGMTYDDERAENMALSDPYLVNQQVVVTTAENDGAWATAADLAARSVAVESGSAGETVVGESLADVTVIEKTSQIEALTEVALGTADAAVVDAIMANYLVNKEGSQFVGLAVRTDLLDAPIEDYVVGLRKGSDLLDDLNDFLEEATESGEMTTLAEKYGLTDRLK